MKSRWPKDIYSWINDRTLYLSIPFTWLLPKAKLILSQKDFSYDRAIIGGPGIYLLPDYIQLPHVSIGYEYPGILQMINPSATRTTYGCINRCEFCAIGCQMIEPGAYTEYDTWPDGNIICDNNLLACSDAHFDKVCDRLEKFDMCDFEQGLDPALLTEYHAERFKHLNNPIIRLSCDTADQIPIWERAYDRLRSAGVPKHSIRTYVLIGYDSGPDEAWSRCRYITDKGIKVLPMWMTDLDSLDFNIVSEKQKWYDWNDSERKRIMQYYYFHRQRNYQRNYDRRQTDIGNRSELCHP